jgi:hypothetical protein
VGEHQEYVRPVSRLSTFARRYGFDLLIVIGAIESMLEVALRQDAVLEASSTPWVVAPAAACVVLPLSLIHKSEPTRRVVISVCVICV